MKTFSGKRTQKQIRNYRNNAIWRAKRKHEREAMNDISQLLLRWKRS